MSELPDEDFRNAPGIEQTVNSSGDFNEAPPPPPGAVSTTSREAVHGSEINASITLSTRSELPANESSVVAVVADPTISRDQQTSSAFTSSEVAPPIADPGTTETASSVDGPGSSQPFYLPSVPDFGQNSSSSYTAAVSSVSGNPFDPGCSASPFFVPSTSTAHPADPENKEDLVDRGLLAEVMELGFEESIAILAISKTKGVGGTAAAVNWIIEHSNESDFESESEAEVPAMGAVQSASSLCRQHKMVFVVNMSLKMGAGKLAAQVGHATLAVYRLAQRSSEGRESLDAWRMFGEMKVVLKGQSTEMLLELFKQAKDAGLFAYVVSDAGRTQIPSGSRTVLGIFGASDLVDTVTGELRLL